MVRPRIILAVLALLVIVAGSVVAATAVRSEQAESSRAQLAEEASHRADALQAKLHSTIGGIRGGVGLLRSGPVDQGRFDKFSQALLRAERSLEALSFTKQVDRQERAAYEARFGPIVERAGEEHRAAPERKQYFVITLTGMAGPEGVDHINVGADPARAAALAAARDSGHPVASTAVPLVTGDALAFLVYSPIYSTGAAPPSVAERRAKLRGFIVGVFRVLPFARTALAGRSETDGVAVAQGDASWLLSGKIGDDPARSSFRLAGQTWTVIVAAGGGPSWFAFAAIVAGGVLVAVLLGLLMLSILRSQRLAERLAKRSFAERDETREALERSEREYRLLAENSGDWVARTDAAGRFTYCSAACRRVIGRTPTELIGTQARDLIHPDDLAQVGAAYRDNPTREVQCRLRRADGDWVWVEAVGHSVDTEHGETEMQGAIRDITERKRLEQELRRLADHDPLTGLLNRRSFELELEHAIARAARYGGSGAVVLLDLDELKEINDSCGHAAGDQALRSAAGALRTRLRDTDLVGRLGGDEFALVLLEADREEAARVADEVLAELNEKKIMIGPPPHRGIAASAGIVTYDAGAELTSDELLARADRALYQAKASNKGGYVIAEPESASASAPVL